MFAQGNNEEKKLDWMYKGPGNAVEREEYLLGRSIDKSLEQLDEAEKQSTSKQPKNHVEHECIPPSIRDFKKSQAGDQVDLAQKLQEDPLIVIRKREEETRIKLLQNPVQMKKLQKLLRKKNKEKKKKAKKKKKSKKTTATDSSDNSDGNLREKYEKLKKQMKKQSNFDDDFESLAFEKYLQLNHLLSQDDIDEIINLNDSASSSDGEPSNQSTRRDNEKQRQDKKMHKWSNPRTHSTSSPSTSKLSNHSSREDHDIKKKSKQHNHKNTSSSSSHYKHNKKREKSSSSSDSSASNHDSRKMNYDDDSDYEAQLKRKRKQNYGLVKADGSKIKQNKNKHKRDESPPTKAAASIKETQKPVVERSKRKKLTDQEIEQRRKEMMRNAEWRDKERVQNVKRYRDAEQKETKMQDYKPDFLQKQLLKSANSSTVESRIKSNINNIQRSGRDMSSHFSRRH